MCLLLAATVLTGCNRSLKTGDFLQPDVPLSFEKQQTLILDAVPIGTPREDLVAKLKTFRFESERRLRLIAEYAHSKECRSVFLRRYFGEDHPPRCGKCDRCRADRAAAVRSRPLRWC